MGVLGPPDAESLHLPGEVEQVQQAARRPLRAGVPGREIYGAAEPALARSRHAGWMRFVAHGMGPIGHEAPRPTDTGPVPHPAADAGLPLRAGMVLSVETTLLHPCTRAGASSSRRTPSRRRRTAARAPGTTGGVWNPGGTG